MTGQYRDTIGHISQSGCRLNISKNTPIAMMNNPPVIERPLLFTRFPISDSYRILRRRKSKVSFDLRGPALGNAI